ncbi:elicitor-responsive protein 1 isoform X2 [Solanum pennellii]|uniref:Elicitor-responsive protein 1 isoform X2 n=1 Tax=Solanum pennellii TaxID=28526 RepID=A0ABM1GK88_SOLPN|nr:elicitor-responsive protein 1 isoform X2 [Solanum pennellii]
MTTVFGIMEVNLVSARGLKNNEFWGGGIDPYVLIQYRGQERKSSTIRGQGSKPEWNEKFTFKIEYPSVDGQYKLILKLMDHDTFSSDDYLGEATIYLKEFLEVGLEKGRAEIHPKKYSVVGSDQCYCGEIQVGITFTPKKATHDVEEEYGGWKESNDYS